MKRLGFILIMIVMVTSCQEQQKIAFVDNGKVINDYQEKKDIEEKYKGKDAIFQKRRDSLIGAHNLELEAAKIKAQRMSQSAIQKLSQELQQKEGLLGQQLQFEQQQLQQAFNTEIDSVIVKVKNFVNDYGEKNGYTYILGTSDASSTVMYGKEANDLSKIILEALNSEYKKD